MADLESSVSNIETKVDMFIEEMRQQNALRAAEMQDFKNEMRQQNEMRAAEIARVDSKIEKLREQYNADMKAFAKQREEDEAKRNTDAKELRKEISDGLKSLQNLTIAAVVGIVTIGVGVLTFVITSNPAPIQQPPAIQQPAQIQTVDNAE